MQLVISVIWSAIVLATSIGSTTTEEPIGLERYVLQSWTNRSFYGFQGIRYTQPPVGELRFQVSRPYEASWNLTSLLDLFTRPNGGHPCPSPYSDPRLHSEDCLYLNVYTRNLSASAPVIAYIHPGGFYIFSGNADHFGAEYLLEHDVVLVTFNYRLGFPGFVSDSSSDASSLPHRNVGLKDQQLVLRWIRQNIAIFGGDPNCVTLMGSSAGAMSVVLHLVPQPPLFHRAIVMSGGVIPQLLLPRHQSHLLCRQAALLQCPAELGAYECVRRANETELAQSVYRMFEFGRDNPIFLWLPVVEDDVEGAFVWTEDPLGELQAGRLVRVPILCGTTADELSTSAHQILMSSELEAAWRTNFQRVAPISLHYERDTQRSRQISEQLWRQYHSDYAGSTFANLSQLFSDAVINFPVDRLATIASRHTDVYRYKFSYRGSYTNFPNGTARPQIVEHCDDLQYLFTSKYWPRIEPDQPDAHMVRRLTAIVTSFAAAGKPDVDVNSNIEWPKYESEHQQYVDITKDAQVKQKPFAARLFWNELFPIDEKT